MRRPFRTSALIGIGVILISLVLMVTGPQETGPLAEGFFTPVIAFEFAANIQDVNLIFRNESNQLIESAVSAMTFGVRLDFLFMLLYGAFLVTFAITCALLAGDRLFYAAALAAVLAPIFDLLENLQLLSIMQQLGNGIFLSQLRNLHLFTWLKWGALILVFLLLIPFFQKAGSLGRFLAMFAALPFVTGVLAYLSPGLPSEIFALAVSAMILLMILFSFLYREVEQNS
ncbi:MAG: hypothetical protein R3293_12560 [Candidatus Promineifilaceae bacterium]|nr:hypothetical protein [Candidatus Promineifilaceae bacterium]